MSGKRGGVVIEGKTKVVYDYSSSADIGSLVVVESKDKITAFDGARGHELKGKAKISTATNGKVFDFLNSAGLKTSYIRREGENTYIAKKCHMIPLEWVTRRIATGSFLRRNPGVNEGFKFKPVKMETFFKDDANHDPQWSQEQILEAKLDIGGVVIGRQEYDLMARTTVAVFEVLEKAWASLHCALIDMKIEFGVDYDTHEILVSDVIDSDSWRLWPSGDKRLMKDKQVYRNLATVTPEALDEVKRNFEWVAEKLDKFIPEPSSLVVIVMGSASDRVYCEKIQNHCSKLGLRSELRVCSAHKCTDTTLDLVAQYEGLNIPMVFVAVAGRSNGLGPVLSANTCIPVINCPPVTIQDVDKDIWSSLNVPSGLGCATVMHPEAAAQHAANILALGDHVIWAKLRAKQITLWKAVIDGDKSLNK